MQWQPITTVPKDKTVDLWDGYARYTDCEFVCPSGNRMSKKCWCQYNEKEWWYTPVSNPTHWLMMEYPNRSEK